MIYHKITHGYVTQTFNDEGECIGQSFTAGDETDYEQDGSPINREDMPSCGNEYFPFTMENPE